MTPTLVALILTLVPKLDSYDAGVYARAIEAFCHSQAQVPMVAILMQESTYRSWVVAGNDHGIAQINWPTWNRFFELKDKRQLLNPVTGIKLGCRVLNLALETHGTKSDWWGYYHSWKRGPRTVYVKSVKRYLKRLEEK
jgi:hypothetical protein